MIRSEQRAASSKLWKVVTFAVWFSLLLAARCSLLAASSLELVSVTPPRIFTPNGDGCNDIITFRFQTTAGSSEIRGRVFSLSGEVVAELKPISFLGGVTLRPGCTAPDTSPGSYFWDGKDSKGNLVSKGIYLYQIEAGGQHILGTVVVAR